MTPPTCDPSFIGYLASAAAGGIIACIMTIFANRFTMTKKERTDVNQTRFETTSDLMTKQNEAFQDFTATLTKVVSKTDEITLSDFMEVATSGEKLFYQQHIISEAILTNKVTPTVRDNTLIPSIKDTLEKTVPQFYNTLHRLAERKGFQYDGAPRRKDYESLFQVLERYMPNVSLPEYAAASSR